MCEYCNELGFFLDRKVNCDCDCLKGEKKPIYYDDRLGTYIYDAHHFEPYCPKCGHFTLIDTGFSEARRAVQFEVAKND
jgi:hypothetical protein